MQDRIFNRSEEPDLRIFTKNLQDYLCTARLRKAVKGMGEMPEPLPIQITLSAQQAELIHDLIALGEAASFRITALDLAGLHQLAGIARVISRGMP